MIERGCRGVRASLLVSVALVAALLAGSAASPSAAVAASRATGLGEGFYFGCALMATHTVECWGKNTLGQLGNGTTSPFSDVPLRVKGILHAVGVTAGQDHACALLASGGIKCWGRGAEGELGDGRAQSSSTPVIVKGIAHATRVAAGGVHTCALVRGGAVKCWGDNLYGEDGDGSAAEMRRFPVQVVGLKRGATWVSAGYLSSCAVQAGVAKCWGENPGDGIGVTSGVPKRVLRLGTHTRIANAGYDVSCALVKAPLANAAWCWGANNFGQIGDGTEHPRLAPVRVVGMAGGVTSISTNYGFACAVRVGAASCWGDNTDGKLGDGSLNAHEVPMPVTGLASGVVKVTTGYTTACALMAAGGVRCWGYNADGELGDGNAPNDSHVPVKVHL